MLCELNETAAFERRMECVWYVSVVIENSALLYLVTKDLPVEIFILTINVPVLCTDILILPNSFSS